MAAERGGTGMKITTAAEMREIDRLTTERFGVPSLTLMENAGSAVADFAREHFGEASRIAIVCGKGNNGGDGFVAARKLHQAGKVVEVLLLAEPAELRGDATKMFERLPLRAVVIGNGQQLADELSRGLGNAELIIDAVLGTGFRPPVTGLYARAIEAINRTSAKVLAVDIPSGADSDALAAQAGAIARADAIVTFTAPRPAHLFGNLSSGPVAVASIGSPPEAIASALDLFAITSRDVVPLLARRAPDANIGRLATRPGDRIPQSGAPAMAGMQPSALGRRIGDCGHNPLSVAGGGRPCAGADDRSAVGDRNRRSRTAGPGRSAGCDESQDGDRHRSRSRPPHRDQRSGARYRIEHHRAHGHRRRWPERIRRLGGYVERGEKNLGSDPASRRDGEADRYFRQCRAG